MFWSKKSLITESDEMTSQINKLKENIFSIANNFNNKTLVISWCNSNYRKFTI